MADSLYGPGGFFVRDGGGPAAHFRTSATQSRVLAQALARLLVRTDQALGTPARLDLVDVGAGRAELLTGMLAELHPALIDRLRVTAVELAPRPSGLDERISWAGGIPPGVEGLLIATEWLDNVPLDVVEVDGTGEPRYVLVGADGTEAPGPRVEPGDAAWLRRWWPLTGAATGVRAEIGAPRDAAWRSAVASVRRGVALTIDYGHTAGCRPAFGTLTGFRDGRQVRPVPDGTCDLTAHVAMDSLAAAGAEVAGRVPAAVAAPDGVPPTLQTQREALPGLGVTGGRPPLTLAGTDPAGYVRALAGASAAAELLDPAGLGGHYWLTQPVGVTLGHTEA
ncbi:MAG TPA: SAM-dependent methyltransferase [Micromonosporaceae bacterium]|nr:SAM-dependent methyltransferase [Micromonosporaceae bacterium]